MSRGNKDAYTDKQKRKAGHIAEGYEERGVPHDEAERRAWATVNAQDGGGKAGVPTKSWISWGGSHGSGRKNHPKD